MTAAGDILAAASTVPDGSTAAEHLLNLNSGGGGCGPGIIAQEFTSNTLAKIMAQSNVRTSTTALSSVVAIPRLTSELSRATSA